MVLFSSLEHIFTTIKTNFKIYIFFCISIGLHGVCGIFRPHVQGSSKELISTFLSSMILYNHPSYFKSGEINSCRLSPVPSSSKSGVYHQATSTCIFQLVNVKDHLAYVQSPKDGTCQVQRCHISLLLGVFEKWIIFQYFSQSDFHYFWQSN